MWVDTKFDVSNVLCDRPYSGISLTDFNDIRLNHIRVIRFSSQQGNILALRSDATNASNVVDGTDIYGNSYGTLGDNGTGQTAYLIDGNVNTVIGRNFQASDISGSGVVVSNVVGNANAPQFIQLSDLGLEFLVNRGVDLEAGLKIGVSGTSFVHSPGNGDYVSCSSSAGLYVANGVTRWGWIGGDFDGAAGDNIYVNAAQGTLVPQQVANGSQGSAGTCPGVEFGGSAVNDTLTGAAIGLSGNTQAEPILLDSGASDIIAIGNTFSGNANSTVVDNSGSITNVLVPNANDTTPGWAFDHVDQVFGIGMGATYVNNGSRPGLAIRGQNNNSDVRESLTNTGVGTAEAALEWSTTDTANAFAFGSLYNNNGAPYFQLNLGSGVSGGIKVDASGGGAGAPLTLTGGSTGGVVVSNLSTAGLVTTASGGQLGSEATATVAQGGTGSASGALSVWSCVIPDTSGAGVNWCPWKAANSAVAATYFDNFTVTYQSTCSTTYPIVEIYDVTRSTALGSTTVPSSGTTVTSVNASASSAAATDEYAFRITTAGSGCSTALATEFISLTASMRN
jgi:hypothetical protein